VLLIVLITIGATYAYFSAQAETGTQTVTTGTLTMNFDKEGSVVTINGITPINDNEIETKAAAFPFSITNTGTAHMKLTIKLKDIVIADDLKDIDFRWGLYNTDKEDAAGTEMGVSFGIFKYAETGGEEIILRDVILDSGSATKNYVLRIWIHDDGSNQNYMQGETFSAKIDVTGEAVDYTPDICFLTDGEGTITEYDPYGSDECTDEVIIPKTIGNERITGIANDNGINVFHYYPISSVVLPDSVTYIGENAFAGTKITHLTIPDSTIDVSPTIFGDHSSTITSVTIPESVTTGVGIHWDNPITTIVVPGSITEPYIDFSGSDIILMDGIRTIPYWGMVVNTTPIEIPSSVNRIESWGFFGGIDTNLEIIVRGKTEAPSGFSTNWNCIMTETGSDVNPCTEYANVIYRP